MLPDCIDDYVDEENPVRAVDAFVEMLDLAALGFDIEPEATGRPGYHPATILKLYVYGYLNQVQSSRRLERECGRNLELIWLMGRLKPDFKSQELFDRNRKSPTRLAIIASLHLFEIRQDKGLVEQLLLWTVEPEY